ncbi:unnamed protein product, partial [Urochloa humidicola]
RPHPLLPSLYPLPGLSLSDESSWARPPPLPTRRRRIAKLAAGLAEAGARRRRGSRKLATVVEPVERRRGGGVAAGARRYACSLRAHRAPPAALACNAGTHGQARQRHALCSSSGGEGEEMGPTSPPRRSSRSSPVRGPSGRVGSSG